ncbi:MAG: hypothetical protein V7K47_07145 [Nostoc sp.]
MTTFIRTDTEIRYAEAILKRQGIEDFIIYDASPGKNQRVGQQTAIFDNTHNSEDPAVIIVDRRDKTI